MNDRNYVINCEVKSIGTIQDGEKFYVSASLPTCYGWYGDVGINIERNGITRFFCLEYKKSKDGYAIFDRTIDLETSAIMHYYFTCYVNGEFKFIKNGILDSTCIKNEEKSKLSVNFRVPDYAKGAMMYHVFVDRFCKGRSEILSKMPRRNIHESWDEDIQVGPDGEGVWNNDFYGGDLKGIEEKLDYLMSLGIDIIYLSPVAFSQSNHRYDTADYMEVDPYAGCNDDLKSLCDAAHEKGIKIILDMVFNHTGNDSKYFNEYKTFDTDGAFNNPDSLYSKFYRKRYENGKVLYDYWWGMKNLPVCDGFSKEWREYITGVGGVIDHWFSLGIDGVRLDVADELLDEFIELIRVSVKRNKEDAFILGEVWKNPMRMNRGYIESGKGMDSVMNYPLIDALIRYINYKDAYKLDGVIREILTEYPKDTINTLMNFTSTHDISRLINIFGCNEFQEYGEWAWNTLDNDNVKDSSKILNKYQYNRGKMLSELYVFILTFLPGILSIFYGDEVGVQGLGNLANRKPYPWGSEDMELLEYFRYVGSIRKKESFLKEADLNIIDINKNYLMFERTKGDESILFLANNTNGYLSIPLPQNYTKNSSGIYTLRKSLTSSLTPYGALAIKKKKDKL